MSSYVSRSVSQLHRGGRWQRFVGYFINIIDFKLNKDSLVFKMDGKSIYSYTCFVFKKKTVHLFLFSFVFFPFLLPTFALTFTQKKEIVMLVKKNNGLVLSGELICVFKFLWQLHDVCESQYRKNGND